jgi:hypothetical protein
MLLIFGKRVLHRSDRGSRSTASNGLKNKYYLVVGLGDAKPANIYYLPPQLANEEIFWRIFTR